MEGKYMKFIDMNTIPKYEYINVYDLQIFLWTSIHAGATFY